MTIRLSEIQGTLQKDSTTFAAVQASADDAKAGRTNMVINGTGAIRQRGGGTTAKFGFGADRFSLDFTGTGITALHGVADDFLLSDVGKSHMFLQSTTVKSSLAVGDFIMMVHKIEGITLRPLKMGRSDAEAFTLSFKAAASNAFTMSVALRNSGASRSYVTTVDVAEGKASYEILIPGDVTGTWLDDTGTGVQITFALAASQSGTFTTSTLNAWQAGNFIAANTQGNGAAILNQFVSLGDIQLERGSKATAFENRHHGEELELCQRYYFKTFRQDTAPAQNAGLTNSAVSVANAAAVFMFQVEFPVVLRGVPSIITYNPGAANSSARNNVDATDTVVGATLIDDRTVAYGVATLDITDANDSMFLHFTADAEL